MRRSLEMLHRFRLEHPPVILCMLLIIKPFSVMLVALQGLGVHNEHGEQEPSYRALTRPEAVLGAL